MYLTDVQLLGQDSRRVLRARGDVCPDESVDDAEGPQNPGGTLRLEGKYRSVDSIFVTVFFFTSSGGWVKKTTTYRSN